VNYIYENKLNSAFVYTLNFKILKSVRAVSLISVGLHWNTNTQSSI